MPETVKHDTQVQNWTQ